MCLDNPGPSLSLGLTRLSNFSLHSGWFLSCTSRFSGTHVTPVFVLACHCFLSLTIPYPHSRSTLPPPSLNSNVIGATSFQLSGPTYAPYSPASTSLNSSAYNTLPAQIAHSTPFFSKRGEDALDATIILCFHSAITAFVCSSSDYWEPFFSLSLIQRCHRHRLLSPHALLLRPARMILMAAVAVTRGLLPTRPFVRTSRQTRHHARRETFSALHLLRWYLHPTTQR